MSQIEVQDWIVKRILSERTRQDQKWGEQNHDDHKWLAILVEEIGEVAKGLLENPSKVIWTESEITQVAAVCMAWLECIERRK